MSEGPGSLGNIPMPAMPPARLSDNSASSSPAQVDKTAEKRSDWSQHKAPDGRVYYYNSVTRQSSWEKPDELRTREERLLASCPWKQYKSDTGKLYYHNKSTGQSSWTKPQALIDMEAMLEEEKEKVSTPKPANNAVSTNSAPSAAIQAAMEATLASIALPPVPAPDSGSIPLPGAESAPETTEKVYVFKTKKEAIEGFKQLLRDKKVPANANWEQALATIKPDKRFAALKSLNEKKQHFNAYKTQRMREEKEEARLRVKKAKEDLEKFLMQTDFITSSTKYSKADKLLSSHEDWRLVPDKDRRELFEDISHVLAKKEKEKAKELRRRNMHMFGEILEAMGGLCYSTEWAQAQQMLLETEAFTADTDLQNMDKEDALMCFEEHIRKLEHEHDEELNKQRMRHKRQQRKNREAFLVFLDELHEAGRLSSLSKWSELYRVMREDIRFANMLGQPGSTPLDLFKFYVEDLRARFNDEKKMVKEILKEKGFIIDSSTRFADVSSAVFSDERGQNLDQGNVKLTFDGLISKAEAREKERLKEEARRHRKLERMFESMLRAAEPEVKFGAQWEDVRKQLEREPAFQAIVPESERIRLFQEFMQALQESCLHKHPKRKKRDKKNKRARERSASEDSDSDKHRSKRKRRSRSRSASEVSDRPRKHKKKSSKKKKQEASSPSAEKKSRVSAEPEEGEIEATSKPPKDPKDKTMWDTSDSDTELELQKRRQELMQQLKKGSSPE